MICIVASTNRKNSNSLKVAHYYKELLDGKGVENTILDLSLLPTDFAFSALYEQQGKNVAFNTFTSTMIKADKIVFVVPEYNGSFPGVIKTFIDGLDYPAGLKQKKCALISLSSGVQGGSLALSHLTDILHYLQVHVLPNKPRLARIDHVFKEGKVVDPFLSELIARQVDELIAF